MEHRDNRQTTDPANHFLGSSRGLAHRTARGGAVTLVSQVARAGIKFVSTVVLARLLTPQDFGLLAMVATFTRLITEFKDLGLSQATIQRRELSHDQVSGLFWINAGVGLLATLLIALSAPLIARFYQQPEVTGIAMAVGCAFVITGLGAQHAALLRRQMRFGHIALSQVLAAIVGTAISVWLALAGFGYWALVAMNVSTALTGTLTVWVLCGWRPSLPRRATGLGAMIRFGTHLTIARLLNFCSRNADNILIGKFWGAELLGYYTKAYSLLTLPIRQFITPVSGVVVSALSRLQDEPERYVRYYKQTLTMITSLTMPLVAFAAATTPELVLVVLGERWREVIPIFQCLIPAAFVGTYNGAAGWVYVSLGRTDRQVKWGLISAALVVLSFAVGLPWGPVGVAIGFSVMQVLLRHPGIAYALRDTFLSPRDLYSAIRWPVVASWFAGIVTFVAGYLWIDAFGHAVALVSKLLLFGVCYAGFWAAFPQARETALVAARALRALRPAR